MLFQLDAFLCFRRSTKIQIWSGALVNRHELKICSKKEITNILEATTGQKKVFG